MRFTIAIAILAASYTSAVAQTNSPHLTPQGYFSLVRGRAHVEEGALGTYIEIERPDAGRSVAGFIPFGDEPSFRELANIEGRTIEIGGVVELDGRPLIVMTDPNQLAIVN